MAYTRYNIYAVARNEVALQRAKMRMVRWMCGVKLQDRIQSKGLRERLGLDDIISVVQQNRLQWYGHAVRKEDNDWVKKCMEYEVEGTRPRGRPKKTWREIVEKDCKARGLNSSSSTTGTGHIQPATISCQQPILTAPTNRHCQAQLGPVAPISVNCTVS